MNLVSSARRAGLREGSLDRSLIVPKDVTGIRALDSEVGLGPAATVRPHPVGRLRHGRKLLARTAQARSSESW
jgi:hypothetical protein